MSTREKKSLKLKNWDPGSFRFVILTCLPPTAVYSRKIYSLVEFICYVYPVIYVSSWHVSLLQTPSSCVTCTSDNLKCNGKCKEAIIVCPLQGTSEANSFSLIKNWNEFPKLKLEIEKTGDSKYLIFMNRRSGWVDESNDVLQRRIRRTKNLRRCQEKKEQIFVFLPTSLRSAFHGRSRNGKQFKFSGEWKWR
jgi:hypothetical protein